MKPKSNNLFHFTKSRETLKLMMKYGFWPRYCLEDVNWIGWSKHEYVAYPMVCFCDIPLSRISEHVAFYGEFGIGLSRQWAESNGLNPVLYIAGENRMAASFRELNEHANKFEEGTDRTAAKVTMRYLLAHSKPTSGRMVVEGKPVEKAFYQESEWRYVPKHQSIAAYLLKTQFEDLSVLEKNNELTKKHCLINFGPQDIRYIFVKSDSDIPDIVNFIQVELDRYPGVDQKILMSRIVSLESLSEDL